MYLQINLHEILVLTLSISVVWMLNPFHLIMYICITIVYNITAINPPPPPGSLTCSDQLPAVQYSDINICGAQKAITQDISET